MTTNHARISGVKTANKSSRLKTVLIAHSALQHKRDDHDWGRKSDLEKNCSKDFKARQALILSTKQADFWSDEFCTDLDKITSKFAESIYMWTQIGLQECHNAIRRLRLKGSTHNLDQK